MRHVQACYYLPITRNLPPRTTVTSWLRTSIKAHLAPLSWCMVCMIWKSFHMATFLGSSAVELASRGSRIGLVAARVCLGVRGLCTPVVLPNSVGQPDYDYNSCTAKQYRWHKNQVLRQNRQNPHLEAKARLKKCECTLHSDLILILLFSAHPS